MNKIVLNALALAVAASNIAIAEEAVESLDLIQEIIITAQKREQNIMDVPISVDVVEGDDITALGLGGLEDLSALVPGLIVQEGSQSTRISIRGMGSGPNAGFEQSVGMFIDGIYNGRDQLFRQPFLDVTAVEVVKGPQSALFGKNTTAGAVSISSAQPDDFFEAHLLTDYTPEFNEYSSEAVVSGPLAEGLNGRLAIRQTESDGYLDNKLEGSDAPAENNTSVRGTLVWKPSERLELIGKFETSEFESAGASNRLEDAGEFEPLYEAAAPQFSTGGYDRFTQPERAFTRSKLLSLTSNLTLDNDAVITSVTGWSGYSYVNNQDVDFGPLELLTSVKDQEYEQFSQELRLTSPAGGAFEYIVGAFYQKSWLDDVNRVDRNFAPVIGQEEVSQFKDVTQLLSLQASEGSCGTPPTPSSPQPLRSQFPAGPAGNVAFVAALQAWAAGEAANAGANQVFIACNAGRQADALAAADVAEQVLLSPYSTVTDFSQEAQSWALFSQLTWNINEDWSTTFGLRYTEERKSAQRTLRFTEYGSEDVLGSVTPAADQVIALATAANNVTAHNLDDSYSPENLSPSLKFQYDWSDSTMVYASVSKAYKSGGFNSAGTTDDLTGFGFEDEEVLGYEIGAKSRLLGGRANLAVAAFHNAYDNLQVSSFEVGAFEVTNAAEAVTQGVEVSGVWNVTPELTFSGAVTWLDTYYRDFQNANCTVAQFEATADGAECTQDLSGEELTYSPEWGASFSLDHRYNLGNDIELISYLGVVYVDQMYLAQDLDSASQEREHVLMNLRLGLASSNGDWEVSLLAKNVTDEEVRGYTDDVPGTSGGSFAYVLPPRSVALQFKLFY